MFFDSAQHEDKSTFPVHENISLVVAGAWEEGRLSLTSNSKTGKMRYKNERRILPFEEKPPASSGAWKSPTNSSSKRVPPGAR